MKFIITIIIVVLGIAECYSQWTTVASPLKKNNYFTGFAYTSEKTIWANTSSGIYISHDGGNYFSNLTNNIGIGFLYRIQVRAINDTIAYIYYTEPTTQYNLAFKTTDGGITFYPDSFLNSIFYLPTGPKEMIFFDDSTGVAFGDSTDGCTSVFRTTNCGKTWNKLPCEKVLIPNYAKFRTSYFFDEKNLHNEFAIYRYESSPSAIFFVTHDKGQSWNTIISWSVRGPIFKDSLNAIARGYQNGGGVRTFDGGRTWDTLSFLFPEEQLLSLDYINYGPNGMYFCGSFNAAYYSLDDGKTWKQFDEGPHNTLMFYNERTGISSYARSTETSDDGVKIYSGLPVGLTKASKEICELIISPNPALNNTSLTLITKIEKYDLFLFNQMGQMVKSELNNINKGTRGIDLTALSSGIYYVCIKHGDSSQVYMKLFKTE